MIFGIRPQSNKSSKDFSLNSIVLSFRSAALEPLEVSQSVGHRVYGRMETNSR